ncbi:MAG: hypothetical protein ACI93N_002511, partial [Flavobacteriaceae bacterium]
AIDGKTIKEGTITEGENEVNVPSNSSGLFILHLFDSEEGSYVEFKVIKL